MSQNATSPDVANVRPAPYYEHAGITIYNADCRDLLPSLSGFGLALTDPPYNVGIDYGTGTNDTRADYRAWCSTWLPPLRAAADAVALTPGIGNLMIWANIAPPDWTLCWHKPSAMSRCYVGFNNWEPVLYWGPRRSMVDVVTAVIVPDWQVNGHPCPKPLKWASGLIANLSDPGAAILDPFAGSGTVLRAAKDAGRRAVGIEIEERYCEIAARRMAQEVLAV